MLMRPAHVRPTGAFKSKGPRCPIGRSTPVTQLTPLAPSHFLILSAPLESPPGHAARPQDAANFKHGFLYTVLEIDLAPQCPGSKMCSEKGTPWRQELFCKETTSKTGFVRKAGPGGGEATRTRQQSANAKFGVKTRSFDRIQCKGKRVANYSVPAVPAQGRSRWKHRGHHTPPHQTKQREF